MTLQRSLFDLTIQERFEEFHERHPEVYASLVQFTREAVKRGKRRIGIRLIWERVRWYVEIEQGDAEFKLNDHFHSRYARLIQQQEPDLYGVFETRKLKA